jgi:hypothetical protein
MKHPVRADVPAFGSRYSAGLTSREYIATQVLAALAGADDHNPTQAAEKALAYADALLAALAALAGRMAPALSVRLDPHRDEDIEEDDMLDLDALDQAGVEDGEMN